AIGITDVNSLAGVVRAYDAAKQVKEQGGHPPKLLVGARLCFADAPDVLVWAMNRAGYARLCRLLTLGKRRTEKGECALKLEDLLESNGDLVAAVVWGGTGCLQPAIQNTACKQAVPPNQYGIEEAAKNLR